MNLFTSRGIPSGSPASERLHLGCGRVAPAGWLNCDGSWHVWLARHPLLRRLLAGSGLLPAAEPPWPDTILRLNLCRPLPFPSGLFAAVYGSHFLEHLHREQALALLTEIHRCLRPGGVVRMAVPDLEKYLDDYRLGVVSPRAPVATRADTLLARLQMRPDRTPPPVFTPRGLYQRLTDFNTHKWHYDADSLIRLFRDAGFPGAERREILDSRIREIGAVEHPERIGGEATLIVEAVRP